MRCFQNPFRFYGAVLWVCFVAACGGSAERCLESGACGPVVAVKKISENIPLEPDAAIWTSEAQAIMVELGPQMITNPKWPDPSIKEVEIRALQNNSTLAIRLEWEDDTLDHRYGPSANYTDQAALMFPLTIGDELPPITMGGGGDTVNIWQWRAIWEKHLNIGDKKESRSGVVGLQAPARASPVEDLNAEGFSTLSTQDEQNVEGKGVWKNNRWSVVFRRPLVSPDNADVQLNDSSPMAVAVWNGGNRERNGQKGLAGWLLLRIS